MLRYMLIRSWIMTQMHWVFEWVNTKFSQLKDSDTSEVRIWNFLFVCFVHWRVRIIKLLSLNKCRQDYALRYSLKIAEMFLLCGFFCDTFFFTNFTKRGLVAGSWPNLMTPFRFWISNLELFFKKRLMYIDPLCGFIVSQGESNTEACTES